MHGKDTYFALDDSGGTLRNISADVDNVDFNQENDVHDNTTFGAEGHTFAGGLTNGTIAVSGMFSITADTGTNDVFQSLIGYETPGDFEYGPQGNANGNVKKSGQFVLENFNVSSPVADLVKFTASLRISGVVAEGTFSA